MTVKTRADENGYSDVKLRGLVGSGYEWTAGFDGTAIRGTAL